MPGFVPAIISRFELRAIAKLTETSDRECDCLFGALQKSQVVGVNKILIFLNRLYTFFENISHANFQVFIFNLVLVASSI